ncbi:pancreatic progenitor cell differentiation and proliferation factor [Dipodomys spectabilis]|uniref:pancreatic progenitor cell differentiation and proliferation factor n=1 Tax=Dipodomys spectabilis TaxID=105255 RepID=UPI001C534B5A|nr:pancreatic progenitor cell differentiation and proliferation factor [Dipodomys spectabilis]
MAAIPSGGSLVATHGYYRRRPRSSEPSFRRRRLLHIPAPLPAGRPQPRPLEPGGGSRSARPAGPTLGAHPAPEQLLGQSPACRAADPAGRQRTPAEAQSPPPPAPSRE